MFQRKMTSSTSTHCGLIITVLLIFASFHLVISTSTPAASMPPCASQPCENGGSCIEYPTAFQCRCTREFTGLRCEIPVSNSGTACDENPCAHGICVSSAIDRYTCMCPSAWRGTDCQLDVNECLDSTLHSCDNGTVCVNEDGGYSCEDPCSNPNPCEHNGTCTTTEMAPYYQCSCPPIYEGRTCDILVETGDPCLLVDNMCLNGGECFSFGGATICNCSPGYQGEHCEIETDVCHSTVCQNGGTCVRSPDNTASCVCPLFYSGPSCNMEIPTCESLPCNSTSMCVEDPTVEEGFYCMFVSPCHARQPCGNTSLCVDAPETSRGYNCSSPCAKEPCQHGGICQTDKSAPFRFHCICGPDYRGLMCEEVISPCSKEPCLNGGICATDEVAPLGYRCICEQGYQGLTCEVTLTPPCATNPCQNGASCETRDGDLNGFDCICQQGYKGPVCEVILHAVCTFEGVTYQENSKRTQECNTCHCQEGSWHCTNRFCGEIKVSFTFIQNNSFERDEEFTDSLKEDIASHFEIDISMIQVLTVSGNPIEVEFQLKDTLDSDDDINNVAADMLLEFVTGSYTFQYKQSSFSVNSRSVVIERHDGEVQDNNGGQAHKFVNTTLVIVCVVVSIILVFAVLFGIAIIVVYKRRSRKEQIYCRKEKNTNGSNNVTGSAIMYHNNIYNRVPTGDIPLQATEIRLQNGSKPDINISMEAKV